MGLISVHAQPRVINAVHIPIYINAVMDLSTMIMRHSSLLTLQQTTCLYVIGNLQNYTPRQLCLLPVNIRFIILINIPVADVLKLEHTCFAEGVDMQSVWSILTKKTLPAEYMAFAHSPLFKGTGSMKELYMEVLATIIFNSVCNKHSASGYQNHRELALDLMFSIRNCMGIKNWEGFLASSPSWRKYFQTFTNLSRQDRMVPMTRYQDHYLSGTASDMCLVTHFLSECYYFPNRVSIIASPFVESTMWTDKFYPMVMERMRMFISRAEALWFSAIGEGDVINAKDSVTSNFPCALRFILSEILANPMPNFNRICIQALDIKTLSSLICAVTPLLGVMKQPYAQYCVNMNHAPYRYLREFSVGQPESGPPGDSLAHALLFECLACIILHQDHLEELTLHGIDLLVDCPTYGSLAGALLHYASRPSMAVLYFTNLPVLRPLLQDVVEKFLQGKPNRNQILHLNKVLVDPNTVPPNGIKTVVNMMIMKEECIDLKQLKITEMYLPPRMIFWLFHNVHIFHLHTLELHSVNIDPPFSLVSIVARHPNLYVQKLSLSNIDIPRCGVTTEDFKLLLTKKCLRILSITACRIGEKCLLHDLAMAINRIQMFVRSPVPIPFVEVLNLSDNNLGHSNDYLFRNFCAALFRQVIQPNLGLDIRNNRLTPRHFTMMYMMWAKHSGGRKLKQLQCHMNHLPLERQFMTQMAQFVFV